MPFSHGFGLAERVIRGKRRVGSRRIRRAQSPAKTVAGDVKDFTEAARRTFQFAAHLQQASAASGTPANINLLHAPSIRACNAIWACKRAQESRGLHDKFTAPCKACRPAFAFRRRFRQMGRGSPFSRPVRHGMVTVQEFKTLFRTGNSP
ncbi:hypothetical protein [Mesorhizobium sp.]|uniref:Uncharacterized protein n=1 Tax=Mesorhizobium shonense TaxID=1209948 RepID=A0ABV2HQV3_9HYPH|nr:hypothetical protein [Mesorhizobium sp.]